MPTTYCAKCGQRLHLEARFCDSCGEPIRRTPAAQIPLQADNNLASASAGNQLREPGIRDESETQGASEWGISVLTLNDLIGLSFLGAPLDTEMLLVTNEEEDWCQFMPLALIENLQGLKVEDAAMVVYFFDDVEAGEDFRWALDHVRNFVPDDVAAAFLEMKETSYLLIRIHLFFKPRGFEQQAAQYTGKWATVLNSAGRNDVRLVTQLSLSGWMLKRRMAEHEIWLSDYISDTEDAEERNTWHEVLRDLRSVMKKVPDGFVSAAYCIGTVIGNGKSESTVLSDADLAQAGSSSLRSRAIKTAGPKAGPKSALIIAGGKTPGIADVAAISGIRPSGSVRNYGKRRAHRDQGPPPHAKRKLWSPFSQ
jgi:hypothetical protein